MSLQLSCKQFIYCDPSSNRDYLEHIVVTGNDTDINQLLVDCFQGVASDNDTHPTAYFVSADVEFFIHSVLIVTICCVGVLGNLLSLLLWLHRSVRAKERMERFAMIGLCGLAASDLCFCVCVIPQSFVQHDAIKYEAVNFSLLYNTYINATVNVCILCSTLLTVFLALGRYVAVTKPIRARDFISPGLAKRMIAISLVLALLANLPRFWLYKITEISCFNGASVYIREDGIMTENETLYLSFYFTITICLPFLLLVYCNVFLLKELKVSIALGLRHTNQGQSLARLSKPLTLCLVVIIIAYLVLVVPGEVVMFCRGLMLKNGHEVHGYNVPILVTTCMQAVNFSFNFLIYCSLSKRLRRTLRHVCLSMCKRRPPSHSQLTQSSFGAHSRSTMTTSNANSIHLLSADRSRH